MKIPSDASGLSIGLCCCLSFNSSAALERFTTGLAQEVYDEGIGVNVISPGLVETPGVIHHKLITDETRDRVTPMEYMTESCLRLVHGDAKILTGRIDYADQVMQEFNLEPTPLI